MPKGLPEREIGKYSDESYIAILPLKEKKKFEAKYQRLIKRRDILALLNDKYYAIKPQALEKLDTSDFKAMWTFPLSSGAREEIRRRLQEKGIYAPL